MNMFAKFNEIPSMILQDIKETTRYGQMVGRSFGRSDGQCENSIPSHKHSLRGGITRNQRTNGPVNAHLISGPTVSTKQVAPILTLS